MFIETIDNLFSDEECKTIFKFASSSRYIYGISDAEHTPPTGLESADLVPQTFIDDLLAKLRQTVKNCNINDFTIQSTTLNLFIPGEHPHFHKDIADGITVLYYCTDEFDVNNNGETQFRIESDGDVYIHGVFPRPGRAVVFHGSVPHRATSFRNKPRFTLAIRMSPHKQKHESVIISD